MSRCGCMGKPPPPATRSSFITRSVRKWTCLDRKSTRLNSSHLVISYAVFCLKKKKNGLHPHGHLKHLMLLEMCALALHRRAFVSASDALVSQTDPPVSERAHRSV